MDATQFSDVALLQAIKRRDTDALEAYYDRHAPALYDLILRIVREAGQAEAILVDSFWELWQPAQSSAGEQPRMGWLYHIACNKSVDYLRHEGALSAVHAAQVEPFARTH
jgi:RNA polymerase sigma-70 factor (ECF subfamily)